MGASQPGQVFQQFKPTQTSNINFNSQFIQPSLDNLKESVTFKPSQALNVNFTSKFYMPRIKPNDEIQDSYVSEISLIRRPVKLALEHSAIFIQSIFVQNGKQVKKYHIVEYMTDSQVHIQQIDKFEQSEKNIKIENTNWKISEFYHDEKLKNWNLSQIQAMMKSTANQKGEYSLLRNNCNQVANEFFQILKNKNI
ncbi:hypothetical protein pb186bvf_017875 [Paramecium bursaria]